MLNRLERQDLAERDTVSKSEASLATDTRVEFGFIHPTPQALRGGKQRENVGARGLNLRLQLNAIAQRPGEDSVRLGQLPAFST